MFKMFAIKLAYKYGNEIKLDDSIPMNFCPRVGDVIGDIENHNKWIKPKMKDSKAINPNHIDISFV